MSIYTPLLVDYTAQMNDYAQIKKMAVGQLVSLQLIPRSVGSQTVGPCYVYCEDQLYFGSSGPCHSATKNNLTCVIYFGSKRKKTVGAIHFDFL